jgi:flagellar biogenesis protein FliO
VNDLTLLLRPAGALLVVLALYWAWSKYGQAIEKWIKTHTPARPSARNDRAVTVIESRRLNKRASVTVVEFGGQRILLGVSDGQVTNLGTTPTIHDDQRAVPATPDLFALIARIDDPTDTQNSTGAAAAAPSAPVRLSLNAPERTAFGQALKAATATAVSSYIPTAIKPRRNTLQ